jgi:hypothetical protein
MSPRTSAVTLEQLANNSKGEVAFEIGPPCPENQSALLRGYVAGGIKESGLAGPGPAFYDQESAITKSGPDRRQFCFAFEKPDPTNHRPQ